MPGPPGASHRPARRPHTRLPGDRASACVRFPKKRDDRVHARLRPYTLGVHHHDTDHHSHRVPQQNRHPIRTHHRCATGERRPLDSGPRPQAQPHSEHRQAQRFAQRYAQRTGLRHRTHLPRSGRPDQLTVLARGARLPSREADSAAHRDRGLRETGATGTTEGLWTPQLVLGEAPGGGQCTDSDFSGVDKSQVQLKVHG